MTTVLIISLIGFLLYVGGLYVWKGWPNSISESFYILEDELKDLGYLFTVWCWFIGITAGMLLIGLSTDMWFQFLGFLSAAGLCFLGTAPKFKTIEKYQHYMSTFFCGVPALLWCILMGSWIVVLLSFIVCTIACIALKKHNPLYWAEMAAFAAVYITLFSL